MISETVLFEALLNLGGSGVISAVLLVVVVWFRSDMKDCKKERQELQNRLLNILDRMERAVTTSKS